MTRDDKKDTHNRMTGTSTGHARPIEARLIEQVDVGDALGEGVLWDHRSQTVWWTDISGCRLHRLAWPGMTLRTTATPERLTAFSFIAGDERRILAAFESGVALFDPDNDEPPLWLDRPAGLGNGIRLNDGRTDPGGRFWVGSMVEPGHDQADARRAVLYRCSGAGQLAPVLGDLGICNGLGWSPDDKTMYVADSSSAQVFRAPFDNINGVPGVFQPFAATSDGVPDGAAIDTMGRYWSAVWDASSVLCFSPDGIRAGQVGVPEPRPTCVAFGGAGMNLLFVSSAAPPSASVAERAGGALYVYETNAVGMQAHLATVAATQS